MNRERPYSPEPTEAATAGKVKTPGRFRRMVHRLKFNLVSISIVFLIIVLIIAWLIPDVFITIHSGEAGVMYRRFLGGTIVDQVYKEGFYIVPPWDKLTVYNVRIQEEPYEFSALTNEGLHVMLTISIRYQPIYETLGVLHQRVGPEYVKRIVVPEVESTLREIVGKLDAVEIYRTKEGIIQKALNSTLEQVSQRFVKVDDVLIKQIQLPTAIEQAIELKMEQRERSQSYVYRLEAELQEAERKRIEGEGIRDQQLIINSSLTADILKWKGIQATQEIATSNNAKVVVIGNGEKGLPIILGGDN